MNQESLKLTQQEQRAVYWSRSRARLWRKGEESGHVQKLHSLHLDCDADVILLQVEQGTFTSPRLIVAALFLSLLSLLFW